MGIFGKDKEETEDPVEVELNCICHNVQVALKELQDVKELAQQVWYQNDRMEKKLDAIAKAMNLKMVDPTKEK